MEILHNPIFLLLAVVLSGHCLGRIRIRTFSLGSSAIVFTGLLFGFAGFTLPGVLQSLGLILFIYSVGQQAGPGFLQSMKQGGLSLSLGTAGIILAALVTALGCKFWFGFSREITAGLFTGALTSTPGLAVAVELAHDSPAPAAYGVAYTFGVVGVVLFVKFLPGLLHKDISAEEARLQQEIRSMHPEIAFTHLQVTNPNLTGSRVKEVLPIRASQVTITRVLRKGDSAAELATGETILRPDDILRVVGTEEALAHVRMIIGPEVETDLDFDSALESRKLLLTHKEITGKTLGSLNLTRLYDVRVSRITRNGFDCPADPHVRLRHGDILHVVGHPEALKNVREVLGNDVRALYATNVAAMLLGLFCGLLLGHVPLFAPGMGIFTLGSTGGVLVAGLLFGAVRQIGPMITELPAPANTMIRDLGLGLFLAVVGTKAGSSLVPTLQEYGLSLFAAGILITLLPMISGTALCLTVLRIPFLRMLGVLTGSMTSTPGLAAASSLSESSHASTAYATVYPVALIGMIMATKIIMLLG
jgi:putative transport protein